MEFNNKGDVRLSGGRGHAPEQTKKQHAPKQQRGARLPALEHEFTTPAANSLLKCSLFSNPCIK
jgi:hypothetical protein